MAAVLPETDGETNSGELRTAATVGSGGVETPASTYTVNYGSRNNKRVRVRGDLQGAVGGGGWRRGARERKEGGETNPATDAAMAGGGGVAGGGEEKRRRRRAPGCVRAREEMAAAVWVACTGTEARGGALLLFGPSREKRKEKKLKQNRSAVGLRFGNRSGFSDRFPAVY